MKVKDYQVFAKSNYDFEKEYSSGLYCNFLPVCDSWGLKIYTQKSKRDQCYDWQLKASEFDLGPDVGGKFSFPVEFTDGLGREIKETCYCYITERVDPLWDSKRDDQDWDLNEDLCSQYSDLIEEVCDDLLEIGFYMNDDHAGNFGWKNGKLVCIDFGVND